jgi:hypothetical protein
MKAKDFKDNEAFDSEAGNSPSELYKEVTRLRPLFTSNEALLGDLTIRLDGLAKKAGVSVSEFLVEAESSSQFNEDYLEALSLARQIAHFKKSR